MIKNIIQFIIRNALFLTLLFFNNGCAVGQEKSYDGSGNLKYVDPLIGNVGHLLQPTRPTVQLPNQMIRMFPQRKDYMDDQISSFPLNVVSHRLGEVFALKPATQNPEPDSWKRKMTYDYDLEITRPWYYSTYLIDDDVKVSFTPGKKTGYYKFEFPAKGMKALLFENYNQGLNEFSFISANEITGMEVYHDDIKVYLYGVFSEEAVVGTVKDNKLSPVRKVTGKDARAWVRFPQNTTGTIEFKYAISYVSAEQAKKNYNNELKNMSFDQQVAIAEAAWAKVINQIKTTGATEAQRRSFYTALYRCYERMVDITEDGQYFSGFDHKIHQSNRPFYVDDWAWDTYLAHHPLRIILNPEQEEDMLNSYVKMYEQSGWMPTFPVLFGDHACMNGFHSTVSFLDAHRKGLKNFDLNKAYEGSLKNANEATMIPWRNGPKTELDDFYHSKGYFPALNIGEKEYVATVDKFEKRQAVAVTLGHSYDDWALGQLAKDMGKQQDYAKFNLRGQNYKNLWSNEAGLFLPKDNKGNWIKIDPKFDGGMGGRDYYDENNGWTYMWQVQHDVDGLMTLMGGRKAFENKLDQLFREPLGRSQYEFQARFPDVTGIVGQFSMGNEPGFHIPYLYNYTSSPWKTQKRIRFLLDTWFKDNVFGIPGDEDGGGMTAFVVFSAMGFYPVTPGIPVYTIGSPVFEKVAIDLPNGKTFQIIANKSSVVNKYIQSAKFDGKVLDTPWFTHQQLIAGGKLELEMGPLPNKIWGTGQDLKMSK
ncbi:MAG: GH92 family glycosyl hydrolase [Candidatus Pedobacter colombiensis]|uniref:GH92 family glycosyl hydrolase n=1 Tax=Candidatus Pedobacter colombiensis TaxID=3121371 RepID=A0AAJ5W451_9SPHI|nr:GH92 family glycosyl hydrolase [Pedobacter sp.]WEK17811.1 MAG: GH92 family glycosyl hydrolase [Pedobacter sp.]